MSEVTTVLFSFCVPKKDFVKKKLQSKQIRLYILLHWKVKKNTGHN